MNFSELKFSDIYQSSNKPGIYAWFLIFKKRNSINEYSEVFHQKKLDAKISGNLGENYEGPLRQIPKVFKKDLFKKNNLSLISKAFAPPIYIGVSNDLCSRLIQHADELDDILYSSKYEYVHDLSDEDLDSPRESKYFASRLGKVLKKKKSIDLNSLLIKTCEFDDIMTRQEIYSLEYFLNRTYKPLYGRK